MKPNEFNSLIQEILTEQVKNAIIESISEGKKEVFHIKCDGEPVDTFNTKEEAEAHLDIYKKQHPGKQFIIEKSVYESDVDMIDKLDEMGQQLEEKENQNMEKTPVKVKSIAEAILHAKENNKKKIKINNESYDVDEYWKRLQEEEGLDENDECMECGEMKEEDEKECKHCGGTGKHGDDDCEKCNGNGKQKKELMKSIDLNKSFEKFKSMKNMMDDPVKWQKKEREDRNLDLPEGFDDYVKKMGDDMKTSKNDRIVKEPDTVKESEDEKITLWYVTNDKDHVKNISKTEKDAEKFLDKALKGNGSVHRKKVSKKDYDDEKITVSNIKNINENKKIRLKESEFVNLISKIVTEAMKGQPGIPGIPGVTVTKKAQEASKKESDSNTSDVEKKMKDYLSFDGNDNPEFPNQIGGDKMAVNNTEDQDETVEDNRGRMMVDLDYDTEPSETFKKRVDAALNGDSKMGNPKDAANAIPSKLGTKIKKDGERAQKLKKEEPLYHKEPAPIRNVNESGLKMDTLINEEIEKIKKLTQYNKKTQ